MIADEINTNAQKVRICVPAVALVQSAMTPRRTFVFPSILNGTRKIAAPRVEVTRNRTTVACENFLPIDVVASVPCAVILQSHWLSENFATGSVTAAESAVAVSLLAHTPCCKEKVSGLFSGPRPPLTAGRKIDLTPFPDTENPRVIGWIPSLANTMPWVESNQSNNTFCLVEILPVALDLTLSRP